MMADQNNHRAFNISQWIAVLSLYIHTMMQTIYYQHVAINARECHIFCCNHNKNIFFNNELTLFMRSADKINANTICYLFMDIDKSKYR